MEITINKWAEHNPRKDYKQPRWFALNNRILEDPDFFDFTSDEFKTWIYILCQASQKNAEKVLINAKHALIIAKISQATLKQTIRKLSNLGIISVCAIPRSSRVRGLYSTLHYNTEHTEQNKTNMRELNSRERDFENIYQKYPLKKGKLGGFKIMRKEIRSDEDVKLLSIAIHRYEDSIKQEQTEPRYIKHFSTFMTSWRDWLDADAGSSNLPKEDAWLEKYLEKHPEERRNGSV